MDYLGAISELNYMTQIVIMLYEDNNKVSGGGRRASVERHPPVPPTFPLARL